MLIKVLTNDDKEDDNKEKNDREDDDKEDDDKEDPKETVGRVRAVLI